MTNQKPNKELAGKKSPPNTKKRRQHEKKKTQNTIQKGGNMEKKKELSLKLTQDIVFKSFFSTNTEILKKVLERFIPMKALHL